MVTKKNLVLLAFLVFILGVVLLATIYIARLNQEPSEIDSLLNLDQAGVFLAENGDDISFSNFDNKVRIINSWATWSPYSTEELIALNEHAKNYQDKNVVVLAVNRNEPPDRIEAFMNTLPELSHITFVRDTADQLYGAFSGYAMPETLFYDAEGNLIFHKRGVLTKDELYQYTEASIVGLTE